MSSRDAYTEQEWQTLLFVPFAVFFAVGYADGSLSRLETGAFVNLLDNAAKIDAPQAQLVREVCSSAKNRFGEIGGALNSAIGRGLTYDDVFATAKRLLDEKTPPEQSQAFRQGMRILATQVAEAAPLIGKKVTDQERVAVERIIADLGA